MKRNLKITFILFVIILCITGCGKKFVETKIDGISIAITNKTKKGATVYIKDTTNNKYTYDNWYRLDKFENNEWQEVEFLKERENDSKEYINNKKELEFKINWELNYGTLKKGKYRIVKKAINESNEEYISVEFEI